MWIVCSVHLFRIRCEAPEVEPQVYVSAYLNAIELLVIAKDINIGQMLFMTADETDSKLKISKKQNEEKWTLMCK